MFPKKQIHALKNLLSCFFQKKTTKKHIFSLENQAFIKKRLNFAAKFESPKLYFT